MTNWKLWFHYSVYRNMLIYFILLVALVILLISGTLYMVFAVKTEQSISDNVVSMLRQTSYTSSIVQQQVLTIGDQMLNDNHIMTAIMNKRIDPLEDRDAMDVLKNIKALNPFIKYIGVYNDNTKRYLNTAGPPYVLRGIEEKRITGDNVEQYIDFYPQKLQLDSVENSNTMNVLTFILRPNYALTSDYQGRGTIIIHVDEGYIQQTIRAIQSIDNNVFVMDSNGIVLSHTNSGEFMSDFSDKPYIRNILSSKSSSGYFTASINGEKQLVTYVKSKEPNWYFVSLKPYRLLISDIATIRNFTLYIALAMIVLGVVLAYIATNRIYNPLGKLIHRVRDFSRGLGSDINRKYDEYALLSEAFSNVVDQASHIEAEMKQSIPMLKKTYLEHALKGTLHDLWSTHTIQADFQQQFTGPYFVVVLLRIDRYAELSECHSRKQLGLFRFSLCNISQELLGKHVVNEPIAADEETVAVLLQPKSVKLSTNIILTMKEIQNVIQNYFHFTVTFSIGNTVSDQNQISLSYQSAQEYAKYRLLFGYGSIIQANMVQNYAEREHQYPAATEKKLIEALRVNNSQKIYQSLDQFMANLSEMAYYQVLSYANQLLITLLKEFDGTLCSMQEYSKECYSIVHRLQQQETLPEIASLLRNFCGLIQSLMEKRTADKNNEVVGIVCRYLQENYARPDLGIESMADKVKLSPGYLGKLFRGYTQTSFNDYLKTIRLEKAKELLVQTDDPIVVISEKVGILNTNYFYTLFKKTYAISPAVYREQHAHLLAAEDRERHGT
ncbi:hypothetical protein SD70_13140 [Gordoniibacillus kamchatkensis]|uniref:HTH araC/xylS-type domain-containing protein n=1 Tax=Gordoniibacillus kamchatkensis TaxID=1590651 RepID=A0ABR5AHS9_9BACL|nr:helix-turn-helix domain-containing protein [Paenibacillus sp. VKM B-2647]KIL40505.1 hypothetical protein SD70_13140 [Paenibacillus sp. VKM B-2647]